MIFFIPVFFLLEDSLPAGVHGTCLPSLPVVVVAPFFAFAGQGGGAVEPDAGVAVLPAPPGLLEVPVVVGVLAVPEVVVPPVVTGGVPVVLEDSPAVPAGGFGTMAVLPSRDVTCRVPDPSAVGAPSVAVPVIFMPVAVLRMASPAFSSGGFILGSPKRAEAGRFGPECMIPVTFVSTPGRSRGVSRSFCIRASSAASG